MEQQNAIPPQGMIEKTRARYSQLREDTQAVVAKVRQEGEVAARWVWHFVVDKDQVPTRDLQSMPDAEAQQDWLRELLWPYRSAYRQAIAMSFVINVLGLFAAIFSMSNLTSTKSKSIAGFAAPSAVYAPEPSRFLLSTK